MGLFAYPDSLSPLDAPDVRNVGKAQYIPLAGYPCRSFSGWGSLVIPVSGSPDTWSRKTGMAVRSCHSWTHVLLPADGDTGQHRLAFLFSTSGWLEL